jgi:predicted nuclease of restriction endonuclease-like (RecB) superfamily
VVDRMNDLLPDSYSGLLLEIKAPIQRAQYEAPKAVNKQLIALYWDIGRMIVERQNKTSWGMAVVEKLAADLRAEFPGMKGFSTRSIWKMRDFYRTYHTNEKLPPLVAEIGWTHNLVRR